MLIDGGVWGRSVKEPFSIDILVIIGSDLFPIVLWFCQREYIDVSLKLLTLC